MTEETFDQVKDECRIMFKLRHPFILHLIGVYDAGGMFSMVLELCNKGTDPAIPMCVTCLGAGSLPDKIDDTNMAMSWKENKLALARDIAVGMV